MLWLALDTNFQFVTILNLLQTLHISKPHPFFFLTHSMHIYCQALCSILGTQLWAKPDVTEWEKIFETTCVIKTYHSALTKNSYNSTTKRWRTQLKKWAKGMNRHFSKKDIKMASKHRKRYSTPLVIRKCQSKPQWVNTLYPLGGP